jgi:hypothetical protein
MIAARHHRFVTGRLNRFNYALVVSCHDRTRNVTSSQRTLHNPTNHGLSGDFEQSFARQTNRIVASGDDGDSFCFGISWRI